jgi:hypothetical protein
MSQRTGISILVLEKDGYVDVEVSYSKLPGEVIGADPL